MNENINLVDILKKAPKGTKLWSPLCGDCSLYDIDMSSDVPIIVEVKEDKNNKECVLRFAANGKYFSELASGECMLFTSKDNRDWSTFKAPQKHKHFEPGQKVLVPYYDGTICKWGLAFYSHYDESSNHHITSGGMNWSDEDVIAYKGNKSKLGEPVE